MGAAAVPAMAVGTGASGFPIAAGLMSGTGGALASGVTAGSILGTGAATSGLLGGLGLNALGGMTSVLPAAAAASPALTLPALATQGIAASAPSLATIFSKAAPALGGLPAGTAIPTAFNAAAPFANAASGLGSIASPATLTNLNAGFVPNSAISTATQATQSLASKVPEMLSGNIPAVPSPSVSLPPPGFNPQELVAQAAKTAAAQSPIQADQNFLQNALNLAKNPSMQGAKDYAEKHPYATSAAVGLGAKALLSGDEKKAPEQDKGTIRPYQFTRTQRPEAYAVSPLDDTSERLYFDSKFTPLEPYSATSAKAKEIEKIASGGIASAYAVGGPVENMSAMNAVGGNMMYPQSQIQSALYSNPMVQRPMPTNVISSGLDAPVDPYTGEQKFAGGGLSDLGGYSDGGRLLKGPGDGVSDSIPAVIGKRQPARLADGEFVIPARIVSELGNGSTEAGARKLYAMMERVQKARSKSVGKNKVAVNSKADKHLPA